MAEDVVAPIASTELGPLLSREEDTFALGVIEYGGNVIAAYRAAYGEHAQHPLARARLLLGKPEVAKRIKELGEMIDEHALISLGSHLNELAKIRDMSVTMGQLKTALGAEMARGKVAGFYDKSEGAPPGHPSVTINLPRGSSLSVNDWAQRQGKDPVIIENGA